MYSENVLALHGPVNVTFERMRCKGIMTHFKAVSQNTVVPNSKQQHLSDLSVMVPELWTNSVQTSSYATHTVSQSIDMSIKKPVIRLDGGHHTVLIMKTLTENLKFNHGREESTLSVNFGVPVY